jgi:hypothetical protein
MGLKGILKQVTAAIFSASVSVSVLVPLCVREMKQHDDSSACWVLVDSLAWALLLEFYLVRACV